MTWPATARTASEFAAAVALGPPEVDDEDGYLCRACGGGYDLAAGCDPSALCNGCAHSAAALLGQVRALGCEGAPGLRRRLEET